MFNLNFKGMNQVILASTLLLVSSLSVADENGPFFGKEATGKWIIGAKVVNIDPNVAEVKDSSGKGLVLGYEFDQDIMGGRSTFELEFIRGEEERISVLGVGDYEANVVNAFFTFRSAGDLFFKLKGGVSYVDIDTRSASLEVNTDFEDTSLAVGVGLGYRIGDLGIVEVEYSQDSGDSDLGILGLNGLITF